MSRRIYLDHPDSAGFDLSLINVRARAPVYVCIYMCKQQINGHTTHGGGRLALRSTWTIAFSLNGSNGNPAPTIFVRVPIINHPVTPANEPFNSISSDTIR